MKKEPSRRGPWLLGLIALTSIIAFIVGDRLSRWWRKPHAARRPPTPPSPVPLGPPTPSLSRPAELITEDQALRRRAQRLETRFPSQIPLGMEQAPPRPSRAIRHPGLIAAIGVTLAAVLPALVVADRWLGRTEVQAWARELWCGAEALCRTGLPGYFAIGLATLAVLTVLLLAARSLPAPSDMDPAHLPLSPIAGQSRVPLDKAGRVMRLLAAAGFLVVAAAGFGWDRLPGWEYAAVIALYLLGQFALEKPISEWWSTLRARGPRLLSLGISQVGLALLLAGLLASRPLQSIVGLVLIAPLVYRLARGERLSPAFWLVSAAAVLYSFRINSWLFSVIGDEYSFFLQARTILQQHGLMGIGTRLFSGQAVYGVHPYFSSLIQAASMALLGIDNFGWRFSNAYLMALTAGLLFLFWDGFLSRRAALTAAVLMVASHYMINFSKIGYNNVQALFVTALVLWAAGAALRATSPLAFTGVGLAMGLCLYVYPAGLYALPLPLLLLFFFMPPRSKQALRAWALMAGAFCLLLLPLLFQPGYWASKVAGTLFNNPDITSSSGSLFYHIGSNFLYSLLSYVYTPEESHFVVASYVDPLTAVFIPIGLVLLIRQFKASRFSRFLLIAFLVELLLVGVTHDRRTPTATRMFLLLPWWTTQASLGLLWILDQTGRLRTKRWPLLLALAAIVGLNIYQAVGLFRQRTEGRASLEVLFLRMLQRDAREDPANEERYLFLTEPNWGIDGIRLLRDVYGMPASQDLLERAVVETPLLDTDVASRIREDNTVVIIQPWMEEALRLGVEDSLRELGKEPCPVSDTLTTRVVFQLWLSRPYDSLCRRANTP